jgi:uncharacterized protein YyaL (SSP411 family)
VLIEWGGWDGDAFARAARERKPVLLSISAAWCRACHEMDRTTYSDAAVAAIVRERFVAVRVDADQRPDINERYNLGGWPTTAFLTPQGHLITGGTFVPVERMPAVLTRVAAEYADRDLLAADAAGVDEAAPSSIPEDEQLVESIFASFDETYGGFGVEPKFPHTAPLHLAMALFHETNDQRWRTIVQHTLDAMADGPLWDSARGGFYRYAAARDWQLPHQERLLETNAALLRAYAEAALAFGRAIDRDRCAAIASFVTTTLRAEGGGYYGSDADRILYVDSNAGATGALLLTAGVLDDSELARGALASFERVMLVCYRPGRGLAHYFDGTARVSGLLADQVAAIGALLDAYDITQSEPYRMLAEELGHVAVRDMWDPAGGGFFDRVAADGDIGLLRQRRKPFLGNAEAALQFARLSQLEPRKGFPDPAGFHEHAAAALRTAGRQLDGQGPLAAHYALARRHLIN